MYKRRRSPYPKKISEERIVKQIRSLHQHNGCSYRTLADIFNCSHSTIEHIVRQKGAYRNFATDY